MMSGNGSPSRSTNPSREDAERALALDEEALRAEIVDDVVQLGVVEALAGDVIVGEQNAELVVDLVEVADALGDEHPPEPQRLFVTRLQRDDPATRHGRGTPRRRRMTPARLGRSP